MSRDTAKTNRGRLQQVFWLLCDNFVSASCNTLLIYKNIIKNCDNRQVTHAGMILHQGRFIVHKDISFKRNSYQQRSLKFCNYRPLLCIHMQYSIQTLERLRIDMSSHCRLGDHRLKKKKKKPQERRNEASGTVSVTLYITNIQEKEKRIFITQYLDVIQDV